MSQYHAMLYNIVFVVQRSHTLKPPPLPSTQINSKHTYLGMGGATIFRLTVRSEHSALRSGIPACITAAKIYRYSLANIAQLNCAALSRLQFIATLTSRTTVTRKPCWTIKYLEYHPLCSSGEIPSGCV